MAENKEAIRFYTKMNKVRADILTLDWKDDKFLPLGGRSGYDYLSIDKIKRNLAPVFQTHGIDLGIEYCDLMQLGDPNASNQHWIIKLKASLIDIDTGFERIYTAFGESSDHGDKGVNKAQTAAMKQILSNTFLLIDGIDPDAEAGTKAGFVQKTPTEELVAKSKVLANAVKPMPVAPKAEVKAKPAPAVAPKAEVEPKEEPKAEAEPVAEISDAPVEVKDEVKQPEVPSEDVKVGDVTPLMADSVKELKVTNPQRSAIAKIVETRTKLAMEGKMSPAEYNQMSADFADIKDQASGSAFISKYRTVGKLV